MKPLITVITPVFNGFNSLKDTLDSISKQSYTNIEYILIDGGSTDGTLKLIEEYSDVVTSVISEHDQGMYDALSKGLNIAKGEIVCYLNSGDMFFEKTLEVIAGIFLNNNVNWVTGYRSVCNEDNIITRVELPFRYKPKLIERGVYGQWLPYIQQESTFWKREMIESVDLNRLRTFKLAGDYYLWFCFSRQASLNIIKTPLGIFKVHEGQLSENIEKYWQEVKSFVARKNLYTIFSVCYEAVFWLLDTRLREKVSNVWLYDFKKKAWVCSKK